MRIQVCRIGLTQDRNLSYVTTDKIVMVSTNSKKSVGVLT